jgi:hypothetical protein
MSFTTIRYLYCDDPNCPRATEAYLSAPNVNETIAEQRRGAAKWDGWVHRNGKDYCEQCRDKPENKARA